MQRFDQSKESQHVEGVVRKYDKGAGSLNEVSQDESRFVRV